MADSYSYTDIDLQVALESCRSWRQVLRHLGLQGTSGRSIASVRNHAAELGLPPASFESERHPSNSSMESSHLLVTQNTPDIRNLRRAAATIAASWYLMCGFDVSWPLEPSRFDLMVSRNGETRRVQVKSTTSKEGSSWKVYISSTSGGRTVYREHEVDEFFIVDGDLGMYVIPLKAVSGKQALSLDCYRHFFVSNIEY